jgi:hypothetical protein
LCGLGMHPWGHPPARTDQGPEVRSSIPLGWQINTSLGLTSGQVSRSRVASVVPLRHEKQAPAFWLSGSYMAAPQAQCGISEMFHPRCQLLRSLVTIGTHFTATA